MSAHGTRARMGTQSQAWYPTLLVSRGEQAGGGSEPGTGPGELLLKGFSCPSQGELLPANTSDLLPPSAPAALHLEPPGAAALLYNKFPVSKKIHKPQFLEVNNLETSERKKTKTNKNLKPAQYQTDTKNMQLADACLASRGSTCPLCPWGPLAHWFESQNHHELKKLSHASSCFYHIH